MTVELLTEHHFEFLSLTGGCTDSSESKLVKTPHCLKSHVEALNFRDEKKQEYVWTQTMDYLKDHFTEEEVLCLEGTDSVNS